MASPAASTLNQQNVNTRSPETGARPLRWRAPSATASHRRSLTGPRSSLQNASASSQTKQLIANFRHQGGLLKHFQQAHQMSRGFGPMSTLSTQAEAFSLIGSWSSSTQKRGFTGLPVCGFNSSILEHGVIRGMRRTPSGALQALYIQHRHYDQKVIDHFQKPKNVGSLDNKKKNVGRAMVGKASCGDMIKLDIEVSEDGKTIVDAKFKTFGCGSAIASSSYATELLKGRTLEEAEQLKNTQISEHLNLPPVKLHCSVLAEEAVQAALNDYKKKNAASN